MENKNNKTISLRELLSYIHFNYSICKNMMETDEERIYEEHPFLIRLVDDEGTYLGGVDKDRFTVSKNGIRMIVDRLDNYWHDYILKDKERVYSQKELNLLNISLSNDSFESFEDAYEFLLRHDDPAVDIVYAILHPESIYLEENI